MGRIRSLFAGYIKAIKFFIAFFSFFVHINLHLKQTTYKNKVISSDMKTVVLIVLFTILFSGCVGEKEQKLSNLSTPEPKMTPEIVQGEVPESAKAVVELAKNDLADKLKTSETSIQVIDVIPVEWTDTSLGYPEAGKEYAQVTAPGYVILLLAEGNLYEYHSDYTRIAPPPGPLEEPWKGTPPVNRTEQSGKVVELAKKHLAEKLQIPVTSIQVLRIISTEWQDASLGYPEPGMVYAQVITPGYVILLQAENQMYEYHSDYERIAPPPDRKPPDRK